MERMDFQKILYQIEEIRALFIFAQRVIPYLEEVIRFVQETTPLIQEVNNSILDSSSKMPAAVAQLDKVSATTEMATSDILDGIDRILNRIDNALQVVARFEEQEKERIQLEKSLILQLAETLDGEKATREAEVEKALEAFYAESQSQKDLAQLRENLLALQTDAYDIMNLMQIQDITTQQIMAANSLIESVQEKLMELISRFGAIEAKPVNKKIRAFDPNATFEDRSDIQALADELLNQEEVTEVSEEKTRELAVTVIENTPQDETDKTTEDPSQTGEKASQEEIDSLFQKFKQS